MDQYVDSIEAKTAQENVKQERGVLLKATAVRKRDWSSAELREGRGRKTSVFANCLHPKRKCHMYSRTNIDLTTYSNAFTT